MYRFLFRPKWIAFHLLVFAGIALMIWLAFWQLRRLDQRREFNQVVTERSEAAPVPFSDALDDPSFDPATAEWRRVTATGTWLPDQIILFNRSQNGLAGEDVITPLALDDGMTVLVDRGFVGQGLDDPPAPRGRTEILATMRPSTRRSLGELTDDKAEGGDAPITEIRRINIDQLAPQLPGEVAPVYLDLIASEPAVGPNDPVPVTPPELTEGPHLSYAFQWFFFSLCALVGWVLAIRKSVGTRRQAAAEATPPPDGDITVEADAPRSPEPAPSTADADATTPS